MHPGWYDPCTPVITAAAIYMHSWAQCMCKNNAKHTAVARNLLQIVRNVAAVVKCLRARCRLRPAIRGAFSAQPAVFVECITLHSPDAG